jgi:hypothetical protein
LKAAVRNLKNKITNMISFKKKPWTVLIWASVFYLYSRYSADKHKWTNSKDASFKNLLIQIVDLITLRIHLTWSNTMSCWKIAVKKPCSGTKWSILCYIRYQYWQILSAWNKQIKCYPSKKSKILGACRNCKKMSQMKLFICILSQPYQHP